MLKIKDNSGSALMVVLIIVVLAALGGVVYWVWHKNKNTSSTQTSSTTNQSSSQSTTTSPSPSPSPQGAVANPCGDLKLSKGSSEGTAGTIYWHAVITNTGDSACTLTGFPKTVMNDTALAVSATHNAVYTPSSVTLAAKGGTAHIVVGLPDPNNFSPSIRQTKCTDASRSNLFLTLPGSKTVIATQFSNSACPGFSVSAIHPGS